MVEMKVVYEGDLHCQATHGPSGVSLATDAPVDNNGKGQSFSPTDLVATALGTCMLTIMGIAAQRNNIDISGARMVVRKEMVAEPVRRIGRLEVDLHVPANLPEADRCRLENAAKVCPVKQSLHPDVEIQIRFHWGC